jgi:hypothetical protein
MSDLSIAEYLKELIAKVVAEVQREREAAKEQE